MASATPTTADRELVFKLIRIETEVIQQLDAFRRVLEDLAIGEHEFVILSDGFRLIQKRLESGDFSKLMTAVSDRIDEGATEACWGS